MPFIAFKTPSILPGASGASADGASTDGAAGAAGASTDGISGAAGASKDGTAGADGAAGIEGNWAAATAITAKRKKTDLMNAIVELLIASFWIDLKVWHLQHKLQQLL